MISPENEKKDAESGGSAFNTILFSDNFSEMPVATLPSDWDAAGEYHYLWPDGRMNKWHDPMKYDDILRPSWLVIEDDGSHQLMQVIKPPLVWPRTIVAGDPAWKDYEVEVEIKPLRLDGFVGISFRYRTSRSHYRAGVSGGDKLQVIRINHTESKVLGEIPFGYNAEKFINLKVRCQNNTIIIQADNGPVLEVEDSLYSHGRAGFIATTTALFNSMKVSTTHCEAVRLKAEECVRNTELECERSRYPQPELWKKIDLGNHGASRQLRFGHLRSPDRLDMVFGQHIRLSGPDLFTIACLTAVDLDGNVLWQFGEELHNLGKEILSADLPYQIYDIDGDGQDEVICLKNFKIYILDGATGKTKIVKELPMWPEQENDFGRMVGDAIIFANLRGLDRPRDIIIKNRYCQIWALDDQLNIMWTQKFPKWECGHYAIPYDFDRDGKDEIFIGYALLNSDGTFRWSHDWDHHTDEIAIGHFDPDRDDEQIAIVSGDQGFNLLAPDGTILHRDFLGHGQRLSAAKYRDDLPGIQFFVTTFWGHAGIISLHDCKGKRIFEMEPTCWGNIMNPVNWTGDERELSLLSASAVDGGLVDGFGRRVVIFPDDGHPELACEAIDLTGDGRDEIVVWDWSRMWIYTQDRPFEGDKVYDPKRYPKYNASNYRAEISLPQPT